MLDRIIITQTNPPPITKKFRLPRYVRVKNPPRMILMERDKEILHQIYLFRFMTREQIERLLFVSANSEDRRTKTSICRKRLKFLYHHGYVDRIPTPVSPGSWAWQPVYRLAAKGAVVVAPMLGLAAKALNYWGKGFDRDHRLSDVSFLFLKHTLEINDFRIAVTQAAQRSGYQVEKWIDDTELKSKEMKDYVRVSGDHTGEARVAIVPDAYFILNLGNRRAHFFLELDRATMSNRRWKTRILAYRAYIERGKYQERYQTNSLRILTVTTTPERLANLKKTTEHAEGNNMFWFTTFPQVTPSTVLSSPIWSVAQATVLSPLITF